MNLEQNGECMDWGDWESDPTSDRAAADVLGAYEAAKQARIRLQQCLMALRRGTFEEIQRESPFSRYAEGNMENLLRAWMEEGEAGFTRKWSEIFRSPCSGPLPSES